MNYTLNQLQIFLKVVQQESVTKAAEELFLTQPAVSIQLKNFQDQFDIPLTEIVGRRLYVTEFGKEIAIAAENILNEVNAINYKTLAHKGLLSGRLKISVVSTGKYVMPYFLSGFLKRHPGIELWMDVTNKSKVIESLEGNEVDFSLVSVMPENLYLEGEILLENKLYLVGNSDITLAKKEQSKSLFEKYPIIYREKGSATRRVMEEYLEQNGIKVNRKIELTSNEAVKQAIIAGLGYSVIPLIGMRNELKNENLKIIPIKGFPIKTEWKLVWLRNKNLSIVAATFLNYLQKEKINILNEHFQWTKQQFT